MLSKDWNEQRLLLFLVVLAFALLSWTVASPYLAFIAIGFLLAYLFNGMYRFIKFFVRFKPIASFLTVIIVLICVLLPTVMLGVELVRQANTAYTTFRTTGIDIVSITEWSIQYLGIDPLVVTGSSISAVKAFIASSAPNFFSQLTNVLVGLLLMLFTFYFGLQDGRAWHDRIQQLMPFTSSQRTKFFKRFEEIVNALLFGQFATALIQGVLGGIAFYFFGFPNAVLWGFVMGVLALLPFLGTPLVFIPASIYSLLIGDYWNGLGLFLFGILVLMNIDNFLRPKLVGATSGLPPVLVLLGAIGGIAAFGFIGFVIGPLVLALTMILLEFIKEDHA